MEVFLEEIEGEKTENNESRRRAPIFDSEEAPERSNWTHIGARPHTPSHGGNTKQNASLSK